MKAAFCRFLICKKTPLSFLRFPCVCPEPVLVKCSFLCKKWTFSYLISGHALGPEGIDQAMVPAREKPQTLFASQLFLKTDISPRQAQEKHNKISSKMAFITQAWRMSRDQTTLHGDFHRGNLFYHKPTLDSKGVLAVEDIVAIDWCGKRRRLFPRVPSIQNDLVTRTGSGQASRRL